MMKPCEVKLELSFQCDFSLQLLKLALYFGMYHIECPTETGTSPQGLTASLDEEERRRFMPNLLKGRLILLRVALIGRSNHCLTNLTTTLTRFSMTHVLERSAAVRPRRA